MNNFRITVLALIIFAILIFIFEQLTNPGPTWLRLGTLLFLGSIFLAVYMTDKLKLGQESERTFLYFAYGSNMCTEWLSTRCPSAQFIGVGTAENYRLVFTKPSKDGSGKATMEKRGHAHTLGVIFEINESERPSLDEAERGYDREHIWVWVPSKQCKKRVATYLAAERNDKLLPYDWYLALMVRGAEENGLPEDYTRLLEKQASVVDTDTSRNARKKALKILGM